MVTEISTSDVTAFENTDYHPISNRLLPFDVQQTNHTIDLVTAAPDFHVEGEERLLMCLDNPYQGVLGLYGLIRCTTVVIEDCDSKFLDEQNCFMLEIDKSKCRLAFNLQLSTL